MNSTLFLVLLAIIFVLLFMVIVLWSSNKDLDAEVFDLKVANRYLHQQIRQARIHLVSKPPDKLFDQDTIIHPHLEE